MLMFKFGGKLWGWVIWSLVVNGEEVKVGEY